MLKRILSGILVLTIMFSISACNSSSKKTNKKLDNPSSSTATGEGWKLEKPVTLTAMGHMTSNYVNIKDYNDIPGMKKFSELTNLNFVWQCTNDQNQKEQINLSFASKKMPDIYTHMNLNDAIKYGDQGALIDLLPLIDKYAPNIKKALNMDPTILGTYLSTESKLYMIPQIDSDYRVSTWRNFIIQKSWLDTLNISLPKTTDELYNTLKAFRDNASKLSNQAVIPYSSCQSVNLFGWFDCFSWAFGMSGSRGYEKNGKIVFGVLQPEFKDAMNYVTKLYKEGLIDPELDANKDDATFEAKMTNNRVGISYSGQGRPNVYNSKAGNTFKNFEFIQMLPVAGPTGKVGYGDVVPLGKNIGLSISINNKYPEETLRAWDYLYSHQGMLLSNFGIEGDTYTIVNGLPEYTDKILKNAELNANQGLIKYAFPLYDFPVIRDYNFERSQLGPKLADYKKKMNDAGLLSKVTVFSSVNLPLTKEERKDAVNMETDIDTYMNETMIKFIKGQLNLDKDYDNFITKLKAMGLERYIEILNKSYSKMIKK